MSSPDSCLTAISMASASARLAAGDASVATSIDLSISNLPRAPLRPARGDPARVPRASRHAASGTLVVTLNHPVDHHGAEQDRETRQ